MLERITDICIRGNVQAESGVVMSEPLFRRYDLEEMGTRFEHYIELKDLFETGIEIIRNLRNHATPGDEIKSIKLIHAVEMIGYRIDVLSGYSAQSNYGSDLSREIDQAHRDADIPTKKTLALPEIDHPDDRIGSE